MATTTTRLALTKPAGTDVVDVDVLNANSDKLDAAAGATICTSTTRPASPYSGQIIYETDTKLTWKYSGGWKLDTGIQPVVASAAARNAIFPSPVVGDSVWRSDLGYSETYYAASGSPARPAGWYSGFDGGLVPIVPTSVGVGSGSATVSGSGLVTFSGVNGIDLFGVFSSTFRNYFVQVEITAGSDTNSPLLAQYGDGSTVASGTSYWYGASYAGNTATGFFSGSGGAAGHLIGQIGLYSGGNKTSSSFTVFTPQLAALTTMTGQAQCSYGGGQAMVQFGGYQSSAAAQFTRLRFVSGGGGTITGTAQVYGIRN